MSAKLDFIGGKIIDGFVVIRLPANVDDPPLSGSQKSRIVASTGGFMPMLDNYTLKIGVNVTAPLNYKKD